jgi:uncharacterized coiled-coil DUF342 family protein
VWNPRQAKIATFGTKCAAQPKQLLIQMNLQVIDEARYDAPRHPEGEPPRRREDAMLTKDEYVAQMKAKLDQWSAEIDELEAKARKKRAQGTQSYNEQLSQLRTKKDEASEKLKEIQSATEDAWQSLQAGTETLWEDLKTTLKESKDAFVEGMNEKS